MVQLSHPYTTTRKIIALIIWTFVSKVIFLFFSIVYACHSFLSKKEVSFNFIAALTFHSDFQKKLWLLPLFPLLFAIKWWDLMPWVFVFWMLSFKPAFSVSSFTLIKKFFSSSSFSTIRVVPSAYLRLLIFLLENLIPACDSSSLAFYIIYSSCKLNVLLSHFETVCCFM